MLQRFTKIKQLLNDKIKYQHVQIKDANKTNNFGHVTALNTLFDFVLMHLYFNILLTVCGFSRDDDNDLKERTQSAVYIP